MCPQFIFLLLTLLHVLQAAVLSSSSSPELSTSEEALISAEGTTNAAVAHNCSQWNNTNCKAEDHADEPVNYFQTQPEDEGRAASSSPTLSSLETTLFWMTENQAPDELNSSNQSSAAFVDCAVADACNFVLTIDVMLGNENRVSEDEALDKDMQFTFYLTIYMLAVLIGASLIAFYWICKAKAVKVNQHSMAQIV
jgi:hypothetical protein